MSAGARPFQLAWHGPGVTEFSRQLNDRKLAEILIVLRRIYRKRVESPGSSSRAKDKKEEQVVRFKKPILQYYIIFYRYFVNTYHGFS